MADSQKKSSCGVNSKEKDSLFDMDMGEDFLSSWKLKSDGDGDDLDFDLPPVSKGSKKSFKFDKVDIDFNMDDDFGKMPSYNFDDLDISPPFKKEGNSKEKTKENSSGKGGMKFSSFDMDMADFGISPESPQLKKDGEAEEKSKDLSKQKEKGKEYSSGKAGLKFSSFDADMPDFDISPPLKKDGKSQEKSKESSKQNDKGKDPFGFAFDFDGLDNFNFEPSPGKKGSNSRKDKDDMESWENFDFEPSSTKGSTIQKDKDSTVNLENLDSEPRLKEDLKSQKGKDKTESLENLNVEPSLAKEGSNTQRHTDSAEGVENLNFESGFATEGSKPVNNKVVLKDQSKFSSQLSSAEECPEPQKNQDTAEIPLKESRCQYIEDSAQGKSTGSMSSMKDQKKSFLLGTAAATPRDGQVSGGADVESTRTSHPSKLSFKDPVTSVSSEEVSFDRANSCQETLVVSNEPPKVIQLDKTFDCETTVGNDVNMSYNPNSENCDSGRNSSSEAPEENGCKGRSSTSSVEGINVIETSEAVSTCTYKRALSKTSPHFSTVAISEKDIKEKSHREIENHVILNQEKTDPDKSNVQTSGISVVTSHKPTNRENQEHASEMPKLNSARNREINLQSDKELASVCMLHSTPPLRANLPQREATESCKAPENFREKNIGNVGVQKKKMKNNDSFTPALDLLRAKPSMGQTGTSVKALDATIRLQMETNRKTAQTAKVPFTLESLPPATKRSSVKTVKLPSAEGSKRTPELCGLKLSTLNLDSAKTLSQICMTSIAITRQDNDVLRNTPKCFDPCDGSRKQTASPSTLNRVVSLKAPKDILPRDGSKKQTPPMPLKRKTLEEYSTDKFGLYPSKRISQSPILSRNLMATSERPYNKKEDDCIESALGACKISAADILLRVNSRALEMSVYVEDDSNIKKAAAYNKELDDICTMLRMKQEEAKELMVRATVNSNKMLMINYPILDQKIRMVESFAALSLKRTCP